MNRLDSCARLLLILLQASFFGVGMAHAIDADEDGLEDSFEEIVIRDSDQDTFKVLAEVLPEDDYDGDGLSNLLEQKLGTSPVRKNGLQLQTWSEVRGDQVDDLLRHPNFPSRPSEDLFLLGNAAFLNKDGAKNYGSRMRALFIPPVTASYTFYVTGARSAVLRLSDDEFPASAKQIATCPAATGWKHFTNFPQQRSAAVVLEKGKRYFIEVLHKQGDRGWDSASIGWVRPGFPVPSIVPQRYLEVYLPPVYPDEDEDGLKDSWEIANGFDVRGTQSHDYASLADPDRDGWSNLRESELGMDPFQAESVAGYLRYEKWFDIPGHSVFETYSTPNFSRGPDFTSNLSSADTGTEQGQHVATRLRGYLLAPTSGDYTFWVAARTSAKLYLSTVVGSKYHKKQIALLAPEVGTGRGIFDNNPIPFDSFTAQKSEPISLVAGEAYYLEVVHQHGTGSHHFVQVAWAPPGEPRGIIPGNALSSYHETNDDVDDDFLPDAWERQHGLNDTDNGIGDFRREGERGDFDGDQLSNREEFLAGTDPSSSDTDADGLSDSDELHFFGTDPLVSNDLTQQIVSELDLEAYSKGSTAWEWIDGGLLAANFRAGSSWNFRVPQSGWWILEVTGRLRGTLRQTEELPLEIAINGRAQKRELLRFNGRDPSSLKVTTPYLPAGRHTLDLFVDNYIGRRTFQITSVRIIRPGGLDQNGDGMPDWLASSSRDGNTVEPLSTVTYVSPAFVEGRSRFQGDLTLESLGKTIKVTQGLSPQHWFANFPLSKTESTDLRARFDSGRHTIDRTVTWVPWDALTASAGPLRIGDTLKFSAVGSQSHRRATVSIGSSTYNLEAGEVGFHLFTTAGPARVTVSTDDGQTRGVILAVHDARLDPVKGFFASKPAWRNFPSVPPSLWVEPSPGLEIHQRVSGPDGGQRLNFYAAAPGALPLVARLEPYGPIVATGFVNVIGYSDSLRSAATEFIGNTEDGYRILRTPIVLTNLPPGGHVRVTIFKAGVSFLDGTREITLTEAEFEDGVAYLDFRYPSTLAGGYCHYIEVFDAEGSLLGRH